MERIKQYYRLCNIKSYNDKPTPLYNQIEDNVLTSILGKKHIIMYLKQDKKGYIMRETVIGSALFSETTLGRVNRGRTQFPSQQSARETEIERKFNAKEKRHISEQNKSICLIDPFAILREGRIKSSDPSEDR